MLKAEATGPSEPAIMGKADEGNHQSLQSQSVPPRGRGLVMDCIRWIDMDGGALYHWAHVQLHILGGATGGLLLKLLNMAFDVLAAGVVHGGCVVWRESEQAWKMED